LHIEPSLFSPHRILSEKQIGKKIGKIFQKINRQKISARWPFSHLRYASRDDHIARMNVVNIKVAIVGK